MWEASERDRWVAQLRATGRVSEGAGGLLSKLHKAVATEQVKLLGLVPVHPDIEDIAVQGSLA